MKDYIGIDFHKQHSSVAVMNKDGDIMDERRLYHTDKKELLDYFSSFPKGTPVSLEATRNWYWLVDLLQDLDLDVKLAHAKKVRIIAESTIKTDKIDAKTLAHLDRCNFLPQSYIADKETRSIRELMRYYMSLVKVQTSIKNRIHTVLAKHNIIHGFSDLFGKEGISFLKELELPPMFRYELDGYLQLLNNLKQLISDAQKQIRNKCKDDESKLSKYAKHLMTIPGISYFSGLLLAAEISDINRFKTAKKLCCYAGLASSTKQTADTVYHGHIIKDSNKYIRYVLIEAIPNLIKKDPKMWSYYTYLKRKKGHNKAKIATAKKLLIAIYSMLMNDTDYYINKKACFRYSQVNSKTKLGAY